MQTQAALSSWVTVRIVNGETGCELIELGGVDGCEIRIVDGAGRVLEPAERVSASLAAQYRAEAAEQPWARTSSRWG